MRDFCFTLLLSFLFAASVPGLLCHTLERDAYLRYIPEAPSQGGDNSDFKIFCYYSPSMPAPSNGTLPDDLNISLCTHISVFLSSIGAGRINISAKVIKDIMPLIPIMKKQKPSLKVFLCNGGDFSDVLETEANRTKFVSSIIPNLRKYSLDGLDLDWEFPAFTPDYNRTGQRHNFTLVVKAIREAFDAESQKTGHPRLLLSAAVASTWMFLDRSYEVDQLALYLDWVNLMSYDTHSFQSTFPFTGYNSPLFRADDIIDKIVFPKFNTAWGANEWVKRGMKKSQVLVGIPTYGHTYTLLDENFHGLYALATGVGPVDEEAYTWICQVVNDPESSVVWDNSSMVPYVYRHNLWISYDNARSVAIKAEWALKQSFGGVMVYILNDDDHGATCDGKTKWPLMNAINSVVQKYQSGR